MSVRGFQEPSFAVYLGIEQGIADRNPEIGDLELLILKMDQDYGGRVCKTKLFAFPVQPLKYRLSGLAALFRISLIEQDQELIAADAIDRKTRVAQNNADPMQDRITLLVSVFTVEGDELIQVNQQEREG